MDRSFLSDQAVVAASRDFVCVRLATYESAGEAKLLESIFTGPTGVLMNTVFTILSPDGERTLARPGRSPGRAFHDAADMATEMNAISERFAGKDAAGRELHDRLGMPYLADVRLGLNVASCDSQRLVVVHATSERQRSVLESELRQVVWSDALVGRLLYAPCSDAAELTKITKSVGDAPQLIVIEPDEFGIAGKVVARIDGQAGAERIGRELVAAADGNQLGSKDARQIIRKARRAGVHWDTEIPVTDKGGRRERGGRRRQRSGGDTERRRR